MSGLRVYDPHAFTYIPLDEAKYGRAVGDYVPVRSETGDWFAVYFPTNQSHKIADIANAPMRQMLEREVECFELTEVLLDACAAVREGLIEADATEEMPGEMSLTAYTVARVRARKHGYTNEEISRAMNAILRKQPLRLSEDVSVTRISDLVEETK